ALAKARGCGFCLIFLLCSYQSGRDYISRGIFIWLIKISRSFLGSMRREFIFKFIGSEFQLVGMMIFIRRVYWRCGMPIVTSMRRAEIWEPLLIIRFVFV